MKQQDKIIELKHIRKCYEDNTPVIYDFNLDIYKGEFITLLGPSGCGKTTILRMLAGFEEATEGQILLNGKDISHMPPNERQINTVFQKYALFPHLNIYDNIAFGLRQKKMSKDEIEKKVSRVLEVVDLEGFEKRSVSSLSGGQQQRVAIARAIVNEPEILLLDEPLGALDYKMRQEMQLELKAMHEELGITFVFVTHDQEEALTMSDKIVVMSKGEILQVGTSEEIYQTPANSVVADFIGESNIFEGEKVEDHKVSFAGVTLDCKEDSPKGTVVDVMVRPEFIRICPLQEGKLQGEVISSIFKGKYYDVTVLSGKTEIIIQWNRPVIVGEKVGVDFIPEGIHIMVGDEKVNHQIGIVDGAGNVQLKDVLLSLTSLQNIAQGTTIEVSFASNKAQLSDDIEEGIFTGYIADIIYKGDHYNYRVVSSNNEEYSVDDEYLWNSDDHVSIIVPEEAFSYRVLEDRTKERGQ